MIPGRLRYNILNGPTTLPRPLSGPQARTRTSKTTTKRSTSNSCHNGGPSSRYVSRIACACQQRVHYTHHNLSSPRLRIGVCSSDAHALCHCVCVANRLRRKLRLCWRAWSSSCQNHRSRTSRCPSLIFCSTVRGPWLSCL